MSAAAVDANLGDLEATTSRFVDAGFVDTGGRDVDWAGKFLNAAKAGIDAYHMTDNYKQQERNQKTQALASATNYIKDTEARAEEQGVENKDMSYFLMKEMENAVSILGNNQDTDDSLSRTYKETFLTAIQSRYLSMAQTAQTNARNEVRSQRTKEAFANVKDWGYSFEETREDLKTLFSDSQISKVWAQAKSGHLAKAADEFEPQYDAYQEALADVMKDIDAEIKASGKTRKEWLESQDPFDSADEYTMARAVADRATKEGLVNPLESFDSLVREALQQEGTDGVGAIAELNTTEGKALKKSVLTATAKIKGVRYKKDILGAVALGQGDVTAMLDSALTGVESEDVKLKEEVTRGLINQTAQWFLISQTDPDPVVREDAAEKLSNFLIRNPDYQSKTITPIANGFAARWKSALDEEDPTNAMALLSEMNATLWSTDTGSATRELLLKASGENFELAMKAHRVGILPEHILELARGNLPEVTQEEYKTRFGADSYAALKNEYMELASENMPWASPKEVADITKFALDFDYHRIGFDKTSFFEIYGEGMSHRASSPATEMDAGESHPITDFFGGKIFVPKSGAWQVINQRDAKQAGYTQGMLHHLFANSNPELTQNIVKQLGMELIPKSYKTGKHSLDKNKVDYFTLNYGEGITDDFQPIRIRRFGQNEWKLELTTKEWLDNVWLAGDRQPFVGITISNDELMSAAARFDTHLDSIQRATKTKVDVEDKAKKDYAEATGKNKDVNIYKDVGVGGMIDSLKQWWDDL